MIPADELARIPVNPPRPVELLPGLRLSRAISRRALALPLAFLGFAAFMPLMVLSQSREFALDWGDTAVANGRVESAVPSERHGCGESTRLVYSFASASGETYRGSATVCPENAYAQVRPGESIPIVYLASDPSLNAISGQQAKGPPLAIFFFFPLFFAAIFVPLLWPRISQVLKDRKSFRDGALARGHVVYARRQYDAGWPGWQMVSVTEVTVSAQLPTGQTREVTAACSNEWLVTQLAPGAEVHVCVRDGHAMLLEAYLR